MGTHDAPNTFVLNLLALTSLRSGTATKIRPGGITQDSLVFNETQTEDLIRTTNNDTGAVYRTTVGPNYFRSWSNLPNGTQVVSTLNLGNQSYEIARDLAIGSVKYAETGRILAFELGNEPNSYWEPTGPNAGTTGYVAEWKNWTTHIDSEVDSFLKANKTSDQVDHRRWWASSSTTDDTTVKLTPAAIIPAGIDTPQGNIEDYSIHNYQYSTCDPARLELATIPNVLNITAFYAYADDLVMPSGRAALQAGRKWIIGEYNSISCSGRLNVTDTATQPLWQLMTALGYASRNASGTFLHQGGVLKLQSSQQQNNASSVDGKPAFSAYDMVYPVETSARGPRRANPGFLSQLVLAEAFGKSGETRVSTLPVPQGADPDRFAAFGFWDPVASSSKNNGHDHEYGDGNSNETPDRVLLLNTQPYFFNSTSDGTVSVDISSLLPRPKKQHDNAKGSQKGILAKRMTSPYVDTKNSSQCTWAGQSFEQAFTKGKLSIEQVKSYGHGTTVDVRGSEALLVWLKGKPFDA